MTLCRRTTSRAARTGALLCTLYACGDDEPSSSTDAAMETDAGRDGGSAEADAAADAGVDAAADAAQDATPRDAEADAQRDASDASDASDEVCETVAPTSCPAPMPTYTADIAPIFVARCLSCHDGSTEQWPLNSYGHVIDWGEQIRAMMLNCSMPPRDSGLRMELTERQQILDWLRCDAPR